MAIYVGRGVSLPADIALSLIPSLPRPHLERLVQQIIDRLDGADGDSDLESGHDAEDDFALSPGAVAWTDGPGCEISDPAGVADEDGSNMPCARARHHGAGCSIADPDIGIEEIWELEQ